MGYGEAPWRFTGQALYQLQLVKADEARKYIPEGLKLVEAFGHTLGGFYLARYKDSPVGTFDELVVMGGLVWNPPTSCAWAARVYVTNKDARNHGIRSVGLPSRLGKFQAGPIGDEKGCSGKKQSAGWWEQPRLQMSLRGGSDKAGDSTSSFSGKNEPVTLQNVESRWGWPFGKRRGLADPVVTMQLPQALPPSRWAGPRIKVVLPSFSGMTKEHPGMLRYACDLSTNVRLASCAKVLMPGQMRGTAKDGDNPESLVTVLSGKPLVAFAFDNMIMDVAHPDVVGSSK